MGLVKKEMSIEGGAIQKTDDHERICRICARSKSQTHISYVNVSQIENLQQKLLKYLNINVTGEDPLPKSICIKCFRMLNLLHEFVLMSRESQKILKVGYADKTTDVVVVKEETQTDQISLESGTEEEEEGFDCDRCWFHCKDPKELQKHQKGHRTKEEPKFVSPTRELFNFICDKCPTEMCNWEQYKRHYWYNHTYNIIKCNYDQCRDLTFQNRAKLRKHNQLKHCLEKPTCYFCNKKYASKLSLVTHIRSVHQKCRNKKCAVCGKCFQTNYNLKTHMKSHTRLAQFSCPECSRPFVYKHLMKKHCEKMHGFRPQK